MATIFDTAKYILEHTGSISTWKLQKLCYYAQAWSLAWTSTAIFDEEFEAWSNGPVCPDLFREHRGLFIISAAQIHKGDPKNLKECEKENIDIVLSNYGDKDAYWLREQTHNETPWMQARGDLPEGIPCQNVISKDSMGEFYGAL